MLEVASLNVFYGESHIVRDASFSLGSGEALAVMGRNGMGKTTLLKAVIGMLRSATGSVRLENQELAGLHSYERVARGLAFVPQGRMIFPLLTVEENILAGMTSARRPEVPEFVYRFFPVLGEMRRRRGGNLSGGQQQMLAIARALCLQPSVLLLDEPTEGLQPSMIRTIRDVVAGLAARGVAVLMVEQRIEAVLAMADRVTLIETGRVTGTLDGAALKVNPARLTRHLGV